MRVLLSLFSALMLLVLVGIGGVAFALHHYAQGLPDYTQLKDYEPATLTRVHAGDGRLLAEFATERRIFVPISAIPKRVINAFLSAEDKNFYHHGGVDPEGIARALVEDLRHYGNGRRPSGASTITQQVAKNFLLTNEVSIARKIKEAILAVRMEQAFTKDHILELYLNEIFLGNRSYGVAAAALNYFNKSLDDLTVAEAAYLGALPKAPNNYNPVRNPEGAVARRNWVIGRMQENGAITAAEAEEARTQPIQLHRRDDAAQFNADYFVEEVRRTLTDLFGEKMLYEGGLSVRTSVDPRLQTIATRAMRAGLVSFDRRHGWRGPIGHMDQFDNWAQRLRAMPAPGGAEVWQMAVVLDVQPDVALIGLTDGTRGQIPMSELKWARRALDDDRLGSEPRHADDVLKLGDVVLVDLLPGQEAAKAAAVANGAGEGVKPDEIRAPGRSGKATRTVKTGTPPAGLNYGLRQIPEVEGGLVAMDPHTGRVLAIVGGFSAKISVFDRATQALRQPGSAFKPFVYLAALNNGFTPSSLILDAPFTASQGPGMPVWRPGNYEHNFLGPTPLRVGVEKSLNVMTARLANGIGMDKVAEYAENFGVVDKLPRMLSMSLGAGDTTVLRMATAYSMLVNGGKRIVPSFIDRVQDRNGKTVWRHDNRACPGCSNVAWSPALPVPVIPDDREQVADPRTVYQMVSILEGVVQRGTGRAIASLNRPLAGKTGTTSDSNDAWFVGFSPDLTVGLYVGYDQPSSLGTHETGASVSVPIFKQVMAEALADTPPTPFRIPPGLLMVRVNPQTGRPSQPGDRNSIWEAFVPGTEPGSHENVLDGSQGLSPGDAAGAAAMTDPDSMEPGSAAAGGLTPGVAAVPGAGTAAVTTNTGTGGLY
ncbi:MAG: penicillin-binding protein 1A [Azospirillaceae bacterium]|nr:penicillin-binding protein 1A [Azospirillaceae bacterium]